MKALLLFVICISISQISMASDQVYISVSYYDGLGETFRVETASTWGECKESKKAQKIFLDKTNELREIFLWRANGKMEGAGMLNLYKLIGEVNAIFNGATSEKNPCIKNDSQNKDPETTGANASDQ